nr:deleted in malignant brain tumors 1 protein-like [Misgurnus anguillicaudatus]
MLYHLKVWLLLISSHITPVKAASIRLVNGSHSCSGRVEVFYGGMWGTVCHDDWDNPDAEVVCREVGCGPLIEPKKDAFFGEGSLPVLMNKAECVDTESKLIDCPAEKGQTTACDHNKDAGVICMPNIRLVNGINSCSGRVEVFHDNQWDAVCDNGWDAADAAVVCRELGCGDVIEVKKGSYFGSNTIWMQDVQCIGNETTLSSCASNNGPVDVLVAISLTTAGVICQSHIRLVNGSNSCSGRVEVYHDGRWGTVCDDNWDLSDAAVVCKELGCGVAIEEKTGAYFGQGSGPVWIKDLDCSNTDKSTVRNCTSEPWGVNDCGHEKDAGVICEYPIRLTDPNSCSGRVEIYHNDQWGGVCYDNGWDLSEATVVCRELGCGNVSHVISLSSSLLDPAIISNVNCAGNESTLMSCASVWFSSNCLLSGYAGVTCRTIKVVNGPSRCSGAVQVLHERQWGAVCHDSWDETDASVVCRELGCRGYVEAKSNAYFGQVVQQTWMKNVNCNGSENSLIQCASELGNNLCGPESHVGVVCEDVTFKFTMRIKVTSDPAVDLNDLVFRKVILEKITEKLQAQGNFTLRWKTLSNGNIFQPK